MNKINLALSTIPKLNPTAGMIYLEIMQNSKAKVKFEKRLKKISENLELDEIEYRIVQLINTIMIEEELSFDF
jgi:hypothetical protein